MKYIGLVLSSVCIFIIVLANLYYNSITLDMQRMKNYIVESNRILSDIIEKEDFMTDLEKATHAGRFDIVEWKCNVNINRTVILTADLHDKYAGEYIEVFGTVSSYVSIKQLEEELG